MISILIIEDEIPARKKLKRFIADLDSPTQLIAELDSVQTAVEFLQQKQPDLIFSDIELLDGNAFDIYQQVTVTCPIIFTTAYDQYWMNAFESNGIAYLLKPFNQDSFLKAWDKYLLLQNKPSSASYTMTGLQQLLEQHLSAKAFKKRFTIRSQQGFYFLEVANILYFEAEEGVVFAYDNISKRHLLTESTLKDLEAILHPEAFFRINRSQIVHKSYIEKIERHNKNILALKLSGYPEFLKTSQSLTAAFKNWVEK